MTKPRFDNLEQWLRWQESCHPLAIDLGLERVRQVAERLQLLEPSAKIITVAGTNGKGSCVTALDALLRQVGCTTGCFSSPHITRYNERVRVGGHAVDDEPLCAAFAAIDLARGDISLTYFEFNALAALLVFQRAELDYWVLEVGLGGRLDATNILDADIAVITSIDVDHEEWLGNDRETIGREKAGICRPGRPLVCADPSPPQSLLKIAEDFRCDLFALGDRFGFDEGGFWTHLRQFDINSHLPAASVAAALQVAELLGVWSDQAEACRAVAVLENLRLAGRFELRVCGDTRIILDVAHNPAAAKYLVKRIQQTFPGQRVELILSMMADKDIQGCVNELLQVTARCHAAALADLPRAASAERILASVASRVEAKRHADVESAMKTVCASGAPLVLVTGSFITVGRASAWLDSLDARAVKDNG